MGDDIVGLDNVVESIFKNEDIHELLTDITAGRSPQDHPYRKLVESQRDEYSENNLNLEEQGFQVGAPWIGDIENAKILFLSSNPAFAFDENCPRYHAKTRSFKMPDGKPLSLEEVKNFVCNYFQNAPIHGRALHIETLGSAEKRSRAVPYWGCIRNNVEALLPNSRKKPRKPLEAYVRNLMSYALCMEIVPFRSNCEIGVPEALDACWENFAQHILAHAAAPVFVLVGDKVRDAFLAKMIADEEKRKNVKETLINKGIHYYRNGRERTVVSVEFTQGKIRRFTKYFPEETLNILKSKLQ
jgi:hypothetical protein